MRLPKEGENWTFHDGRVFTISKDASILKRGKDNVDVVKMPLTANSAYAPTLKRFLDLWEGPPLPPPPPPVSNCAVCDADLDYVDYLCDRCRDAAA